MDRAVRSMFIRIILVLAPLLFYSRIEVCSQNTTAQEERKAKLNKEIEILDKQLKANSSQSSNALSNLTLIRGKVESRKKLIEDSDLRIAEYSDSIAVKEKEVKATKARLDTLSTYYNRLIREAYKSRDAKIWYMYILASDNVGQAFRRYAYLRDLSKQMNIQARKIEGIQAELEKETSELTALKTEAESARARRVSEMNKLQSEESDSKALVNQLNKDKITYQRQLTKKRNEVNSLNREIERIIREAMDAPSSSNTKKSSKTTVPRKPIDYKLAKEFEANKGKLPWPAEGPVVDHFGQRYHPVYTKVKLPFNNGVTIALSEGTAVKAVFDGEVKQIVVMPGYNKCVLVQHGNYFSFYCKLGSVSVKAGDKVKTNQTIGTVDTLGGETQLHFQIWSGKNPQDPEIWLRP